MPDRVAVLAPAFVVSEAQPGREPETALNDVTAGEELAVTVKLPSVPTANTVLLALEIVGAWETVRVNVCVAAEPMPLLACTTTMYEPETAGVPERTPVLLLRVTPLGRVPLEIEKVEAGEPDAVTVKLASVPSVNDALF